MRTRMKLAQLLAACSIAAGPAAAQTVLHAFKAPEPGSSMGASVAGVGDLDGDGYDDVMAGAPEFDFDFETQTARGFVGVYSGQTGKRLFRFVGGMGRPHFGGAVSAAGDVDADGVPDLLFAGYPDGYSASSVHVHAGASGAELQKHKGNYLTTAELGHQVLGGVDLDLDGHDDIVATAPQNFGPGEGTLFVWSGDGGALLYSVAATPGTSSYGDGLAALGDLDADGVPELVVGSTGPGRVEVLSGADGSLLYELTGTGRFGRGLANVGRIDEDAFDDFAVGAYEASGKLGRVYVYSGIDGTLLRELYGSHVDARFGWAIAGPGDLNADGVPDIAVGAPLDDEVFVQAGRITVFSGADGTVLRVLYGPAKGAALGLSLAAAGDVDAGGVPDLIGGMPYISPNAFGQTGKAIVWAGERSPGTYCTAQTTSLGCTPTIWASGVPSLTKGALTLSAMGLDNEQRGVLLWGTHPTSTPFRGTLHCIGPVLGRRALWTGGNSTATFGTADCSGSMRDTWNKQALQALGLVAGQTVHAQFRFASPGEPGGGATDAIAFDVLP